MTISNFRILGTGPDGCQYAQVDVTVFAWRLTSFSKTTTKLVYRRPYTKYWRWVDTDDHTPGYLVESLERQQKVMAFINTLKK